ncbi:MAG: transposase [Peptostreptococcaceae bacterium]|jgi:putative transposase|nr:transposase [Peptostreptococcaceae bacterium]
MKYNKAFKFRIYPNTNQESLIHRTFGCVRFVYNQILGKASEIYEVEKKNVIITPASLKKEFEFLKEVDSLALSNAQLNVKTAFTNFFRKKAKFPKFKSKKTSKRKYTTNNQKGSIRIENNKLKLPKLGLVSIKLHRQIPLNYKIKSATISQEPNGAYYVSILTEFEQDIKQVPNNNNIVGLDFSMKELFVSSDNQRADYPRFFRRLESKLAKEQRKLSRKKKFSNNWYKQKKKVAIVHQKVKNSRKDFLHKVSKNLVDKYNAICIEDLNMKGMSQALKFGKSVADNGWGMFTTFLQYKAQFLGKQVLKVDKFYPSSKTCSFCGTVKSTLKLAQRTYHCEKCNNSIDRDLNASINIKTEGAKLLAY